MCGYRRAGTRNDRLGESFSNGALAHARMPRLVMECALKRRGRYLVVHATLHRGVEDDGGPAHGVVMPAALYRLYIGHRRRHAHCAGTDVPLLKPTALSRELSNGDILVIIITIMLPQLICQNDRPQPRAFKR